MNGLDPKTFALLAAAPYLLGALVGLWVGTWKERLGANLALAGALAGSLLVAWGAAGIWLADRPLSSTATTFALLPGLAGGFPALMPHLYVDRLAAFFLLLTGLLSAGVAIYSFAWLEGRRKPHRIAAFFDLFVLSACALLVVDDVYLFLVFLECITLAFGYLTLYKHSLLVDRPAAEVSSADMEDAKRAFKVYLVSSHAAVILISVALILLALLAGSVGFDALRRSSATLGPAIAGAIFLLALLGFGIKTALAPFQSWMGLTHPYLPTNVHALVSSVIIKVAGIYGMIRVFFEFLPSPAWWWGWLLLLLAGLTALMGVFSAITSRDLKTALANHSVENVGIILAGVGLALLLASDGEATSLAALALTAGLYHLLNHAVFKGLLFLGTGAIEDRTGTVELERLGGLMRRFPWTSVTFLVGAVAIAGFPPLNGFISEWLTLQALFAGQHLLAGPHPWMMAGLFAALLMLGLAFGLTALAFVKIAGEAVLGAPRDPDVRDGAKTGDVPWRMRGVLVGLALLCLLLGLLPGLVAGQLARIPQDLLGGAPLDLGTVATSLTIAGAAEDGGYQAQLSMLPFLALFGLSLLLAVTIGLRHRGRTRGPVWSGGTAYCPESMQIPGGAFAFLVWSWAGERRAGPVCAPDEVAPVRAANGAVPARAAGEVVPWRLPLSSSRYVTDFFRRLIDGTVRYLLDTASEFGERFQDGDIRHYLAYLFVVFVVVLLVAVLWGGLG